MGTRCPSRRAGMTPHPGVLKLAACFILTALRGSTYRKAYACASSLAAALQFEHSEEQGKLGRVIEGAFARRVQ